MGDPFLALPKKKKQNKTKKCGWGIETIENLKSYYYHLTLSSIKKKEIITNEIFPTSLTSSKIQKF